MSSYGFRKAVEALKEAVPLEEYAGELTDLKSAGGDRLKGLCPLPDHQEKTPSFTVFGDGHFYCFGCHRGGDLLDLFMAVEEIPDDQRGTALAELAQRRGVELPGRSDSWRAGTVRKEEIEDLAMRARGQVYKRRAFRILVWPEVERATRDLDPAAREREFERAYAEFGSPERWERYAAEVLDRAPVT